MGREIENDEPEDEQLDDEVDEDESDAEETGGQRAATKWTALSRYATDERAAHIAAVLKDAGIDTRIEAEGRAAVELQRIRVAAEDLDEAVSLLESEFEDEIPERLEGRQARGPFRKLKRDRAESRLEADLSAAVEDEDMDGIVDTLWKLADLDPPGDHSHLARLVDALIDRDAPADLELARLRLEEAMRQDGVGSVATEMALVAIAADSLGEADAWLTEAQMSGADPAEVAFDRCTLAFAVGESRGLKQAASEFRRVSDVPDSNWVEIALLLAAAGETEVASRMLGAALRDAKDLDELEWSQAAALRMVIEGADEESRHELAELVGEEDAEGLEGDVTEWVRDARRDWKSAYGKSKARKTGGGRRRKRS